jgi:hypothetical protein
VCTQYWWPTQGTTGAPGLQYYMRVAAYNDAGFSNWRYYNMNYDNHEPQIIPTKGLVEVEFVITGMCPCVCHMSSFLWCSGAKARDANTFLQSL